MRIIIMLSLCILSSSGYGKTIFEPGLSLGMGSGEATGTGALEGATTKGDGTVASFGFRYGITRQYIHVTGLLEGTMFSGKDIDAQFSGYVGLGIGYEWNIPIRTYILIGAYDFDTDLVGAGLEVAYFVNESFWVGVRYTDYKSEISQTVGTTEVAANLALNTVSLTVSFPIEFSYPDHWFRKTDWE